MKWLFVTFLIFTNLLLFSQTTNWQVSTLNSPNEIIAIDVDTLGFLWMHDSHTLFRYDGLKANSYFTLKDELITTMFAFKERFILGTSKGRIMDFNPYTIQISLLNEIPDSTAITGIYYIDEENYITLSYGNGVVLVLQGNSYHYDTESGLISNEVYDIAYYNRKYYLATDQGIQIFNLNKSEPISKSLTTSNGLSDMVITHLEINNNLLWYTDYDSHVGNIDSLDEIENFSLPTSSKINDIAKDQNCLYVSTDDGLYKMSNEIITKLFPKKGVSKTKVSKVDDEGNIWVYTGEKKLLSGNLFFQHISPQINNIRAITIFNDHMIVGNKEGLFLNVNSKNTPITEGNITHLASTDDYLLVGTFSQGIKVYDKDFRLIQHIQKWSTIDHQSVLHIYVFKNIVYVSSLSGVMQFTIKDGVLTPSKSLDTIIGNGYIYSLVASGNTLYLGTDRNGLVIWDRIKDEVIKIKEFETGEKIGSVYAMTIDIDGQLWFTSKKEGVGFLKADIPHRLVNHKNRTDEYTSLASLVDGNLLAIRSKSIDLINTSELHVMNFDNVIETEYTPFLNTITQTKNKTYFVHDQSILILNPISSIKIYPEVIIDKILVNLSQVKNEKVFKQNENNIEFNFNGIWLKNPTKLIYQYKLKGFDSQWRVTKDRSVAFPKLNPGKYEFSVRASENEMFTNEPIAVYSFEIKKYFYNKWWVKMTGICFLLFLVWQFIKGIEARKKEKLALEKLNIENQLINLKNQLNPHFLFNAFNTLVGLIEEDKDRSVIFVERITDFYRNMLEYGKKDLITLRKEKIILEQYIDILKTRFNGQLDINLDISNGLDTFEIPPMTLQLLIENAVKHNVVSTKNPLKINIQQTGSTILIKNIKRPLISKGKGTKTGLNNINRRFQLVNLPEVIIYDEPNFFEVILQLKIKE